MIGCSSSRRT